MKFTDTYGGRPDKGEKQMKKILTLLLMFVLLAFSTTVFAGWNDRDIVERIRAVGNTPSAQKKADRIFLEQAKMSPGFRRPVVAIVYENNAKTKYDNTIDKKLFEYLDAALPVRTYELIDGRDYKAQLAESGIEDIADAERADIVEILAGSGVDYFLYLGINPVQVKDKGSLFAAGKIANTSLPFRIIDINNNKYIYTKTYTESAKTMSAIGGVGSKSVTLEIMTQVGKQIQAVIESRLPKTVSYTEQIEKE